MAPSVSERFWAKVDIRHPRECWEWQGARTHGYGTFAVISCKKWVRTHRYAMEEWRGITLTPREFVLHLCDNPPCCNPFHLTVGDAFDNQRDCVIKGRRGPRKYHEADLDAIVALRATGLLWRDIAARYDGNAQHISKVARTRLRRRH